MAVHTDSIRGLGKRRARNRERHAGVAIPRDAIALAGSILFLGLGFAAIYLVSKVADVKDGVVLAALLLIPALLYLLLSGRVSELKGPAGLEVRLSEVANAKIPVAGGGHEGGGALAYEEVREVEKGRTESFVDRIRDLTPDDPVVLTLTLGCGEIDGKTAADYAKGLTQFPRFRFVAVLDSHGKLVCYMEERAFRHVIESGVVNSEELLGSIKKQDVGEVRAYPGMIHTSVTPRSSIADALREMERIRKNALLVTENGRIKGIVERDRLANALLLSVVDHVVGPDTSR